MVFVRYGIAGLLIVAALLQLNDPDPLGWIVFYTICGALVAAAASEVQPARAIRYLAMGMIAVAVAWCGSILYSGASSIEELTRGQIMQGMSNEYPGNELLKELGGLVICCIALCVLVVRAR